MGSSLALARYQHRRAAQPERAHCLNKGSCDHQNQEQPSDPLTWETGIGNYSHKCNRKIKKSKTTKGDCKSDSSSTSSRSSTDDDIDDIDHQDYFLTSHSMQPTSPSKPINCPRPSLAVATNGSPQPDNGAGNFSMTPTSPLNAGSATFAGASPKSPTSFMGPGSPRPRANSFSWERERPTSLPGLFGENSNVNVPYTAQRLASYTYGMPIAPCVCTKHHHRRSSVAIKFKNNYMDEYHDPDLMFAGDMMLDKSKYPCHDKGEVMRRPPSPIAERILKGELDSF